jgi:hypothetical protein
LLALPFGPYLIHKFLKGQNQSPYLLNKFYVAGFQYYKGSSLINKMIAGEELELRAEPENNYDKFAVSIHRKGVMVGHIPRSDNKHISRLLQQSAELTCKVKEVHPGRETWKMCKVEIYL